MTTTRTAGMLLMFALVASTARAQTVDDVVALHLASRGGAKWQAIETQKIEGTVYAAGLEMAMVHLTKRPNLALQHVTIDIPGQGSVVVTNLFDGTRAWTKNPMLGGEAQPLAGAEAEGVRFQSDFDGPLLGYRARGHAVELVGAEVIEGRKTHHLRVSRADWPVSHHYIDAETGVEVRVVTEGAVRTTMELSDYRAIEGVQMAHRLRVLQGDQVQAEVVIAAVEFNPVLDSAIFVAR